MNEKIRLRLESFNRHLLASSCQRINQLIQTFNIETYSMVSLPTYKRIYCILRSPHVDKGSFEQFEIRTHKWIMDINAQNLNYLNMLGFLNLPSGVDIKIKINELA